MKITSIRDLVFFVLDIAFLAVMTWLFSSTLIEKWQIEQSEKTNGCVISSRDNVSVSHRKGRRREHHSYSCTFSYEVGGCRYTARDSISGWVTPIGFEMPRKGQPITVFYDSENPQSAKVFNPEIHFLYWIGYIALFAGLWLFWPLRFQRKEMCGKLSDRCVEDSSGTCKLWMGRYWRNANAPIWLCALMILAGLSFSWVTLDTGLAYCKSSLIVGCICLALNFASNFAIYLPISCLMSKINPIQRRHRFLAVSGAIISCIVLFFLWSAFRATWKVVFGIRGKFLLWPLLFYIEGCRGLWRLIVGVRNAQTVVQPANTSKTFCWAKFAIVIGVVAVGLVVVFLSMRKCNQDADETRLNDVDEATLEVSATTDALNENDDVQTQVASADPYADLRAKLIYVAERGAEREREEAKKGLDFISTGRFDSSFTDEQKKRIANSVESAYSATKEALDNFTPDERRQRAEYRTKVSDDIRAKMQFVVDQNDEDFPNQTNEARKALDYLNVNSLDGFSDADVAKMRQNADYLYSAARNRSEKWRLFSDGPKGEWCSTGQMSVSDVIAHNSKRGLLALDSFLGVRFGENFRKYVRDNKRVDLQDGIFMVKAQTNKILDFDKYSLAVLCDGRVVGVEARASIKADSVDAFVGKLLSILKAKYGRICLQQSCDRDIWKIFFPDREHPRGMSGVDVNIVPMSSEICVIVDRPRQGNSLAAVYLFARDVRLWNDCHKVHAQKVAEENERARQKALDAL